MAQGNFARHEYFIDCGVASRSVAGAVFGAWVTVCIAVIAMCVRSMYRSKIKRQLFTHDPNNSSANLWSISPATTLSEVFALRSLLVRGLIRGETFYILASLTCVIVAAISAASTSIANHTIQSNVVTRRAVVPGRLVTNQHRTLSGAVVEVTSRVQALDKANAPLEQLFDFVPDDTSGWIFVAEEWNNTWKGQCSYSLYPAAELLVVPSNSSSFQDEIPSLGAYLPQWATVDPTRQGTDYSGFYDGRLLNNSGFWRDVIATYAFGSASPDGQDSSSSVNISLANVLYHNVGRNSWGGFVETAFKSDVHVVECTLDNATPGAYDQAYAQVGQYKDAATNVANLYRRSVTESSINGQPVVQPTAQQMLRIWQAFMSVKDAQFPHPVQRHLSVSRPVVQIRLSVLATTVGGFWLAIVAAIIVRIKEPRDQQGQLLNLPSSQLDWIALAACEHYRGAGNYTPIRTSATFASEHRDLMLVSSYGTDGKPTTRITSSTTRATVPSPECASVPLGWSGLSPDKSTFAKTDYHDFGTTAAYAMSSG